MNIYIHDYCIFTVVYKSFDNGMKVLRFFCFPSILFYFPYPTTEILLKIMCMYIHEHELVSYASKKIGVTSLIGFTRSEILFLFIFFSVWSYRIPALSIILQFTFKKWEWHSHILRMLVMLCSLNML